MPRLILGKSLQHRNSHQIHRIAYSESHLGRERYVLQTTTVRPQMLKSSLGRYIPESNLRPAIATRLNLKEERAHGWMARGWGEGSRLHRRAKSCNLVRVVIPFCFGGIGLRRCNLSDIWAFPSLFGASLKIRPSQKNKGSVSPYGTRTSLLLQQYAKSKLKQEPQPQAVQAAVVCQPGIVAGPSA